MHSEKNHHNNNKQKTWMTRYVQVAQTQADSERRLRAVPVSAAGTHSVLEYQPRKRVSYRLGGQSGTVVTAWDGGHPKS